jgi:VanZ family protein
VNFISDYRFYRVLSVGWMAMIYWLSCQSELPILVLFRGQDKLEHALVFGMLSVFFFRSFRPLEERPPFSRVLLITFMVATFGGFDEAHQHFVSGREASLWDLAADVTGGFLAAILFWRR